MVRGTPRIDLLTLLFVPKPSTGEYYTKYDFVPDVGASMMT